MPAAQFGGGVNKWILRTAGAAARLEPLVRAAMRNLTRWSGKMHGYGAPGMFKAFGMQSAGGCAHALVETQAPMNAAARSVRVTDMPSIALRS